MKIRKGFVSNSSSSSFVVGFKKIPQTIEEMIYILFDYENGDTHRGSNWGDECYYAYEIAEQVFNDLKDKTPINDEEIINVINSGWFDGSPEFSHIGKESWKFRCSFKKENGVSVYDDEEAYKKYIDLYNIENEELYRKIREAAKNLFIKEKSKFKDCSVFNFSYGDEDGQFMSVMEHGDIFIRLPNIQISHH